MMPDKELDPSTKRLDAILRLLLDHLRERNPEMTVGDQILVLQDVGLSQGEAGKILGVPSNQIPSYLRNVKNKKLKTKLEKK